MNTGHEESSALVDQLRSETCAWGLGTTGPESCMKAFEHAQVEVLILAEELVSPLRLRLLHLAEQAGSRVAVVRGSEALTKLGGAGCLLRYREQDPKFRNLAAV